MLTMRISYVSFKHLRILWDVKPNLQPIRTKLLTSQKCFQFLVGCLVNRCTCIVPSFPHKTKKQRYMKGEHDRLQANCTMDNTLKLKMYSCHNNFVDHKIQHQFQRSTAAPLDSIIVSCPAARLFCICPCNQPVVVIDKFSCQY